MGGIESKEVFKGVRAAFAIASREVSKGARAAFAIASREVSEGARVVFAIVSRAVSKGGGAAFPITKRQYLSAAFAIASFALLAWVLFRIFSGLGKRKTMKAPGGKGKRIFRDNFERNPSAYFKSLHTRLV